LSGSDGVSDIDGSASTPAIRGTDTNTGIFFPAADTIAFAEGGAECARFDSSGNLGLGTTNPLNKLHVDVDGVAVRVSRGSANGYLYQSSTAGSADLTLQSVSGSVRLFCEGGSGGSIKLATEGTERMRIDSSGNLLVGITSETFHNLVKAVAQGSRTFRTYSSSSANVSFETFAVSAELFNGAATCANFGRNSSTNRSINAGGTVNASGADYAEYMVKAGDFDIAKGDVCGINANGKLTNVFADAISFVVKSTDPSYVGGDTWGSVDVIGKRPKDDASQEEKDAFDSALEVARQSVDRIAFAGQVPVNVIGATAGQYIIPVNDNGSIKGEAVSNPTFEQYQLAVGKVIAIENDGRAKIIVKVV
jgi:hypothetical protein